MITSINIHYRDMCFVIPFFKFKQYCARERDNTGGTANEGWPYKIKIKTQMYIIIYNRFLKNIKSTKRTTGEVRSPKIIN